MPVERDLAYGPDPRHRIDIYGTGRSGILWIHGGAFRMGDKQPVPFQTSLTRHGWVLAAMNYRLAPVHRWPAQDSDLRAAVAFLRGRGVENIALWGASAGGFLAAMGGLGIAGIAGVVDWFGPVLFTEMDGDMAASGVARAAPPNSGPGSPESDLIGAVVRDNPGLAARISPLARLAALPRDFLVPPFQIVHGLKDRLIAARQSERLHQALGAASELHLLPEAGHGGTEFEGAEMEALLCTFLSRVLR
jgi:acetyl esterase/lipase